MTWMQAIHGENPYRSFPRDTMPIDKQGWGHDSPIFEEIIKNLRPTTIIEIGTWKGASALAMARLLDKYEIKGEIICIDTWLGGIYGWINDNDPLVKMKRNFGYPTMYPQFITNVLHERNDDVIVPLPVDSSSAAGILKQCKMAADAIYIDGSHAYADVLADLKNYWGLLRPGGIMFGDDYDLYWVGVVRAVHDFADALTLKVHNEFPAKWALRKPE